jgi:hypothetical protein
VAVIGKDCGHVRVGDVMDDDKRLECHAPGLEMSADPFRGRKRVVFDDEGAHTVSIYGPRTRYDVTTRRRLILSSGRDWITSR